MAQSPLSLPFTPKDTVYATTEFKQSGTVSAKILFSADLDYVHNLNSGDSALAKGNHDFTGFYPINGSSEHGYLIVNHEITNSRNDILGDGGGMTVFEVKRDQNGEWQVIGNFNNVDFTTVGGTNVNCGGATSYHGTFLTAEEYPQSSNAGLYAGGNGVQDTSDYMIPAGNGTYSGTVLKKFENYGWMVEVDPLSATALRKVYAMGRFSHEGGWCMPDKKTVYLTDDFTPGVFFKFVADKPGDYRSGQLYAYKQGANGVGGSWITLPMDINSLINIRDIAISMGATTFIRLEWIVEANGKLYITETGLDNTGTALKEALLAGGNIAKHQWDLNHNGDTTFTDYYGRVLELDLKTLTVRPYINGGTSTNGKYNLSNPDGIATVRQNGKRYLVINEDLNGRSFNRMPAGVNYNICEIYYVDLGLENPTVDDAKLFASGSPNAETTGGVFTPDGSTYFVNNQHPASSNPAPWNKAATLAITGFEIPAAVDLQQWSTTPSLVKIDPAFSNVETFGIISSDDYIENNPDYVFGGSADGAGILKDGNGNYTVVVNHEDNFSVSRITLDKNLKPIQGEYLMNSDAGMWRLCSGTLATPEEHGFGPVYLTCGESGIESRTHAVPVFGPVYSDSLAEVPNLTGFGRWSAENAVPLPKNTYPGQTIVIIGDDDSGPDGGQVALYVANQGDLKGGKLYVLRRKDLNQIETDIVADGSTYDVEFVEVPGHLFLTGAQINAYSNGTAKSIRFNRVEDLDYRKGNAEAGREIYFNATGNSNTFNGERTKWGRVYRLVLDENNPLEGKLECILDGDVQNANNPALALIQPDNICVTEDYVYVQEDHNGYSTTNGSGGATEPQSFLDNKKHDGQIYQYDIATKQMVVLMELDHRRNAPDKEKFNRNSSGTSYQNSNPGSWEYGAMIDLSEVTGQENLFLVALQPHTWRGAKYQGVDGGTVRPNENQASMLIVANNVPRVKAVAPKVAGMTICAGETATLEATEGSTFWQNNGTTYKWYTNATGGTEIAMGSAFTTPTLNTTTTYYVSTFVSGMESPNRTVVTVNVESIPAQPAITQNGKVLTSSASSGNQWFRNGKAISGATAQSYTVSQDGFYSVQVSSPSGCKSVISSEVFVYPTSVEDIVKNEVAVFPNPNNGSFKLAFNLENSGEVMIRVVSLNGQTVYNETLAGVAGNFTSTIQLGNAAPGTYIVTVLAGDKLLTSKINVE